MNLHSETSAGLRRAALTLHALDQADRAWLLERLPAQSREVLGELLGELRELRIPRDDEVIRAALSEAPLDASLGSADAKALCLVLADESPVLQSLLLATLAEPQRSAVLQHWPHELLPRPSPVALPAWTRALRGAVMDSWRELARLPEVTR